MFDEIKRQNKKYARRLALASVIAVVIAIVAIVISVKAPLQIQICAKCHNDVSFNNACKKPSSGDIACIDCHTRNHRSMTVMAVEIKDRHCTTKLCHPESKLFSQDAHYKDIEPFSHKTHMDAFIGNLRLRCTSCHSSIGKERHFETDVRTCNACHFMSGHTFIAEGDEPISRCTLCHGPVEVSKEIYEKTFRHRMYEENENVDCSDCHFNITYGTGGVRRESCHFCHKGKLDNSNNANEMHYQHIIRHKTACVPCHDPIRHGWIHVGCNDPDSNAYQQPNEDNYRLQHMIMQGTGGVGIEGEPDPMFIATLTCSACHKDSLMSKVQPETCNNCHGEGFDRILFEQKEFVTSKLRLLKTLLKKAKRYQTSDSNGIIVNAEKNYYLIKEDSSSGVHNIKYIKELLLYSIEQLKQVLGQQTQ